MKFKKDDYVLIVDDEPYKYGHRIPIGTITKIIYVSSNYNSIFPYITQHSKREVRDSEILKIYRIKDGNYMWTEKDFTITRFPSLDDFRKEFHESITPSSKITEFMLIDKNGICYSCDFGGHRSLASILCDYSYDDKLRELYKNSNKEPLDFLIENEGWISIGQKGYEREPTIVCKNKLTKKQENIIYDYISTMGLNKFPKIDYIEKEV